MSSSTTLPSWSVHATVAEPVELLVAFAAHYLALGATEVNLFLDDPTEEAIDILGKMDGVRLMICDAAYWEAINGERPASHVLRQKINATYAYLSSDHDWFLFCDADEFLCPPRPLAEFLADCPMWQDFRRFEVAERFFPLGKPVPTIFDGLFRTQMTDAAVVESVYGDYASMMTEGLTAHVWGKSIMRRGRFDKVNIHFPLVAGETMTKAMKDRNHMQMLRYSAVPGTWLAHFDGVTPLHWLLKLLLKVTSVTSDVELLSKQDAQAVAGRSLPRNRLMRYVAMSRDAPERYADIRPLIELSQASIALLADADGLAAPDLKIAAVAQAALPGVPLDFSRATFDAKLIARHGELIERYGLIS